MNASINTSNPFHYIISLSFLLLISCNIHAQQICLNDTIFTTDIYKCHFSFSNIEFDASINGSPDIPLDSNLPIGAITVVWSYVDSEGVTTTCSQQISVEFNFDNDGILDIEDNCPTTFNPAQIDTNDDGIGDACQPETNECGNQDIMLTLDRSGSISETEWDLTVDFAKNLIDSLAQLDLEGDNRYAVSSFASDTLLAHGFNDDQSFDSIYASIDSIDYVGGLTHTKDAVKQIINTFVNQSTGDQFRANILITDGNPYPVSSQVPCSLFNTIAANAISIKIVAVGSVIDPSIIDCIVFDPASDIFSIPYYTESHLDDAVSFATGSLYSDSDNDGIPDCYQGGIDSDGDGWRNNGYSEPPYSDCDEGDPSINPGAVEICDGVDNNCNGLIDEGFNVDCTPINIVSNNLENGNLSLRYFIENTCVDTINFSSTLEGETITLIGNPLHIQRDLWIQGLGIDLLTIDADNLSQSFIIDTTSNTTLLDLKLDNGLNGLNGGSILNYGNLSLDSISVHTDINNPISITNHGTLNVKNILEIKD